MGLKYTMLKDQNVNSPYLCHVLLILPQLILTIIWNPNLSRLVVYHVEQRMLCSNLFRTLNLTISVIL